MESALRTRLVVVLQVAERQRGLITTPQLRECSISRSSITQLEREGWLRRVRLGVYAIAGHRPTMWDASVAAALAAGPRAALSHRTAAAIHRLPGVLPPRVPELSSTLARRPQLAGVTIHRLSHLDEGDVVSKHGVRVTSPARTIVDLASLLESPLLARLIDEGSIARLWKIAELQDCLARSGPLGRPGSRMLRDLLAARAPDSRADSILELRILRLLAPFAPFETQYKLVLDGRVIILDVAWPWWQVGTEVDGWIVRGASRSKFDWDRSKGNLLIAHGWSIAHLTSAMDDATILRDVGRLLPPFAAKYA